MEKKRDIISLTTNSQVYKYFSKKYNRVVCKKIVKTSFSTNLEKFQKEPMFLENLAKNENCIKLIDYKISKKGNMYIMKIITEFYEKGNLKDYITELNRERKSLNDKILYNMKNFINFFADLQVSKISHRDIKPENIFITGEGDMKIGDFGCSTITRDDIDLYTIQGTVNYLSPELRVGYENWTNSKGGKKINHCPYKSDVFSLGLVFLYMYTMKQVICQSLDIKELEKKIKQLLVNINVKIVKSIISDMLIFDSEKRPDFIGLKNKMEFYLKKLCRLCGNEVRDSCLHCTRCDSTVHSICLTTQVCENCNNPYSAKCQNCGTQYIKTKYVCSHFLCDYCQSENISCRECCKINFIENIAQVNINYPISYKCWDDNNFCEFDSESLTYSCSYCRKKYCAICKQKAHRNSCLQDNNILNINCKCNARIEIFEIDSLFYQCDTCGFRCILCLRSINADHLQCSMLFKN